MTLDDALRYVDGLDDSTAERSELLVQVVEVLARSRRGTREAIRVLWDGPGARAIADTITAHRQATRRIDAEIAEAERHG